MNLIILGGIAGPEVILILLGILILFGGSKLPGLMKGIGQGIREFKEAKDGKPNNTSNEKLPPSSGV
jgi:sec-independent protein translocase protein TatA